MRTLHGIRVIFGLVVIASSVLFSGPARGAAAQGSQSPLIHVPVRWCALMGSDAAADPDNTNDILRARLQSANDAVWTDADIKFVDALEAAGMEDVPLPIIADQSTAIGMEGDILSPETGDFLERNQAAIDCEAAWNAIPVAAGVTLVGPIVINVQRFMMNDVDASRTPGISKAPGITTAAGTKTRCTADAMDIAAIANGTITVVDKSIVDADPELDDATVLAHELGHILNLGHGNGADDDANGPYDQFCDLCETDDSSLNSLMNGDVSQAIQELSALQKTDAYTVAVEIDGAFT